MQELQRAALLDAMGLKAFQPRFQLDNAKPSIHLNAELEPAAEISRASSAEKSALTLVEHAANILQQQHIQSVVNQLPDPVKPQQASKDAHQHVGDAHISPSSLLDPERQRVVTSALETKANTNVGPISETIRFRHRVIRVGELLMLIDQPLLEWAEEKKHCAFFNDIYFALYKKLPEYWQQSIFEWPPSKHFPMANDSDMAFATFTGFLQEHMQQPECHSIICWGEAVAKNVIDEPITIGDLLTANTIPVLVVDEVQQYLRHPLLKKSLWQALIQLLPVTEATDVTQ